MNYMLAGLVWCFSVLLGLRARRRLKARWSVLQTLLSFFETLRLRMEYAAQPLPTLLESFKEWAPAFLPRCCELLRQGASFCEAWSAAVQETPLPLRQEETQTLLSLGALLGTTDLRGQLRLLERVIADMRDYAAGAKQRFEKNAPVCTCLGVFAGFAFFVFVT